MKKMLQLKSGDIPNIHFMLDAQERKLRSFLLNHLIAFSRPIFLREILKEEQISDIDVPAFFNTLVEKGLIALRDDMSIFELYPISVDPTRHRVQLKDGRFLYAINAIASLGVAFELEQDLVISSSCRHCNREIFMDIVDKEISSFYPATTLALYQPLGKYQYRASSNGNSMDFFCSKKHLDKWHVSNVSIKKSGVHCMNLEEAVFVAKAISGKTIRLVDGGKIILTSVDLLNLSGKLDDS